LVTFSLAKQEKVTSCRATPDGVGCDFKNKNPRAAHTADIRRNALRLLTPYKTSRLV
jgi:hypothetical protein